MSSRDAIAIVEKAQFRLSFLPLWKF